MEDQPGPPPSSASAGGVRRRCSARLAARRGAACDLARPPCGIASLAYRWVAARTASSSASRRASRAGHLGVTGHIFPARASPLTPGCGVCREGLLPGVQPRARAPRTRPPRQRLDIPVRAVHGEKDLQRLPRLCRAWQALQSGQGWAPGCRLAQPDAGFRTVQDFLGAIKQAIAEALLPCVCRGHDTAVSPCQQPLRQGLFAGCSVCVAGSAPADGLTVSITVSLLSMYVAVPASVSLCKSVSASVSLCQSVSASASQCQPGPANCTACLCAQAGAGSLAPPRANLSSHPFLDYNTRGGRLAPLLGESVY